MVKFRLSKRTSISVVALLLYVAGSSVLGLALGLSAGGRPLGMGTPIDVRGVWLTSVTADLVFAAGSVVVAVLMVRGTAAALFGFPLSVLVYSLADLTINPSLGLMALLYVPGAVLLYGFPGLIFAGVAPLIWKLVDTGLGKAQVTRDPKEHEKVSEGSDRNPGRSISAMTSDSSATGQESR